MSTRYEIVYNKESYEYDYADSFIYEIYDDTQYVGQFHINSIPNACGMRLFHGFHIEYMHKNRVDEIVCKVDEFLNELADNETFCTLIATDVKEGLIDKLAKECGWKKASRYIKSPTTGKQVAVYTKTITTEDF